MPSALVDQRAFYVKSRPQDADIIELVRSQARVFIGYPPWKTGEESRFDRHAVRKSILDISSADEQWDAESQRLQVLCQSPGYRRQITANRKFARQVTDGSYVVVPRPGSGVVYLGQVSGGFELADDPPWADDYLALRRRQRLPVDPVASHLGDVVQGWRVKGLRVLPYAVVPRWISFAFHNPPTIGWLKNWDEYGLNAWSTLDRLYQGKEPRIDLAPTVCEEEVLRRLVAWVSPTSFEHLMCDVLQLDCPAWRWLHTGGRGDGGVDGLAVDEQGRLKAALQCKMTFSGDPKDVTRSIEQALTEVWGSDVRVYFATLSRVATQDEGYELWEGGRIAKTIVRHRSRLPLAARLAVGEK